MWVVHKVIQFLFPPVIGDNQRALAGGFFCRITCILYRWTTMKHMRIRFQYVVHELDLNCFGNANQRIST